MPPARFIAYYRVSTARQGRSGLGLEAQQAGVYAFLAGRGWPPLAAFTEVESGRKSDRPELTKAIEACRLGSGGFANEPERPRGEFRSHVAVRRLLAG